MNDQLCNEIESTLGQALLPSLTRQSAASDLFEAYIFSLIIEAARLEGAGVSYEDVSGVCPSVFVFRTSPGNIWSTTRPYTHAVLDFPDKPNLEAHVGVYVTGKSGVLHEADVLVLHQSEAAACRRGRVHPRHAKVILSAECKFYAAPVGLAQGRGFLGLSLDIGRNDTFFVMNTGSGSVEKLLASHGRKCEHNIHPSSSIDVDRLRNAFQTVLKDFKAKN